MEKFGLLLLVLATASAGVLHDLMRERRDLEEHTLTIRDVTERSPDPHPDTLNLQIRTPDGETENLILKRNPDFNDDIPVETSHQGVRKRHVTKALDVAEYLSKRAAFHVKSEWAKDRYKRSFTGFLYKRSGAYLVERDASGGHSMVSIETPPLSEPQSHEGQKLSDALQPPDERSAYVGGKTFSRGTQLRPDILLIIDSSAYRKMSQEFSHLSSRVREQRTIQRIKELYGVVWAGVVQKYEQVDYRGMTIAPRAARILILKTASDDSNVIGDHNIDGNNLFADGALETSANWFQDEKRNGQYLDMDHSMVFTNKQIYRIDDYGERSYATIGLAYIGNICEYWASSLIEDSFDMIAVSTAAHELGHNLGASHDKDISCRKDYQMSPKVTHGNDNTYMNQYKFSPCSLKAFYNIMDDLNRFDMNCMTDRPPIDREIDDLQNVVPGLRFTLDQQCQLITGSESAEYCGPEGVCRKLECRTSGSCYVRSNRHALHGTPCGRGKYCENGRCQRK